MDLSPPSGILVTSSPCFPLFASGALGHQPRADLHWKRLSGSQARMKYRKLGRTAYNVSEIGHGLWGMSGWSGSEDRESLESLQLSTSLGCTFFDTAWAYGEGHSDQLIGKVLNQNPDKRLYVASKVPPKNRKWP